MRDRSISFGPLILLASVQAGCGAAPSGTSSAPVIERYVLDGLSLPMRREDDADDLLGNGALDDQLGVIEGTLSTNQDDGSVSVPSMLARCSSLPVVEIVGGEALDSPTPDAPMQAVWRAAGAEAGATLDGTAYQGRFVSTRARLAGAPVAGAVRLPIFSHTDPIELPSTALEIELTRDGTGLQGELHGAVPPTVDIRPAVYGALLQMLANEPGGHDAFVAELDKDHDGKVSLEEFEGDAIVQALLAPDVQLFDEHGRWSPSPANAAPDSISLGFGFHLARCGDGGCCPQGN